MDRSTTAIDADPTTRRPTTRQADLIRRAEDLFPGGVNSPVRAFRSVGRPPLVLDAGEGPRVRDADGRWYIDYIGAWGPAILGHAHPAVVEAVRAAALDGFALGATSPREVELGEAIRAAMPSMERLRFTSSGTEAAMSAIRLARGATGRDLVIKFAGGYHGHSDGLLVEAGSGRRHARHARQRRRPGRGRRARPSSSRSTTSPRVRVGLRAPPGRIAAVIVEPVAANVGVVAAGPGLPRGPPRAHDARTARCSSSTRSSPASGSPTAAPRRATGSART